MSLDVYLEESGARPLASDEPRIFIREVGQQKEISRAEWNARFPDREPVTVLPSVDGEDDSEVYHANITHNLGKMAEAAGLYKYLWRPDENYIKTAHQLIAPLREGLAHLKESPETYEPLNPPNGWGSYEGLVRFVRDYLEACEAHPQAEVRVSR